MTATFNPKQIKILEMMAHNEQTIGQLYHLYAQNFPDYQKFWQNLATEEFEHAKIIRGIIPHIENGQVFIKKDRFTREGVASFLENVQKEIRQAKENRVFLMKAFSTALVFEKSLLERKFFEVFEGDNPDLVNLLDDLRVSTEKHVTRVETAWNLARRQ